MCLATNREIIMEDLENELKTAVDEMLQYDGATVVMVFIPTAAIEMLLKIASEKNTAGKLVFIIPKHVENIQTIVSKYKNPSLGRTFMYYNFFFWLIIDSVMTEISNNYLILVVTQTLIG